MDAEQCVEMVTPNERWGSFHRYRCSRKAGYGKGGLYCKQHAKRNPADDIETEVMYAAKAAGKFQLARCRVSNVTEKALVVRSVEAILGWPPFAGKRYARTGGDWLFFPTAREAIEWGEELARLRVDALRREVAKAEEGLAMLTEMLAADNLNEKIDQINAGPRGVPTGPLTLD